MIEWDMDCRLLTPPGEPLTLDEALDALRNLVGRQPNHSGTVESWTAALMEENPKIGENRQIMAAWLHNNALLEESPDGFRLSMKGVAVAISKPGERKSTHAAWQEIQQLLRHVAWINAAPVEMAPFAIKDILLFGGMAKPTQQDHGDMDAMLVMAPKKEGATRLAGSALKRLGLENIANPHGSSMPSFRVATRQWLETLQPFLSLNDNARVLDVLLGEYPTFSCYSLFNVDWNTAMLEHTTLDDAKTSILLALDNGKRNVEQTAHVRQAINEVFVTNTNRDEILSHLSKHQQLDPEKRRWWANLDLYAIEKKSKIRADDFQTHHTVQPHLRTLS